MPTMYDDTSIYGCPNVQERLNYVVGNCPK